MIMGDGTTMVDRATVEAMVAQAVADPSTHDQRVAAAARVLTGRDVDHDWRGGFALDARDDGAPTPVDARGMGRWTKLVVAQPRLDEAFVTFPTKSDCGHFYIEGDDRDARQVRPYETRSFLVFPRHPADGGPDLGTWVELAEGRDVPAGHLVLYPSRDMEARGFSPYSVTGAAFANGSARDQGYTHALWFPDHPDDSAEEIVRLGIIESDGHRQANYHGGFCTGVTVAAEALEDAGMAEAAAFLRKRYEGRIGGEMVAEEDSYCTGHQTLAIVRDDDGAPLVRQVACVEGDEAVLRHVPSTGDEEQAALIHRSPGERHPLSRCHAYDAGALGRILGGHGTWAERWEAEVASGALVGLTDRAAARP